MPDAAPWLIRGFAAAGVVGCILAAVVLRLAAKRSGSDHGWMEGNTGLLAIFSALVFLAFGLGALMR